MGEEDNDPFIGRLRVLTPRGVLFVTFETGRV